MYGDTYPGCIGVRVRTSQAWKVQIPSGLQKLTQAGRPQTSPPPCLSIPSFPDMYRSAALCAGRNLGLSRQGTPTRRYDHAPPGNGSTLPGFLLLGRPDAHWFRNLGTGPAERSPMSQVCRSQVSVPRPDEVPAVPVQCFLPPSSPWAGPPLVPCQQPTALQLLPGACLGTCPGTCPPGLIPARFPAPRS